MLSSYKIRTEIKKNFPNSYMSKKRKQSKKFGIKNFNFKSFKNRYNCTILIFLSRRT